MDFIMNYGCMSSWLPAMIGAHQLCAYQITWLSLKHILQIEIEQIKTLSLAFMATKIFSKTKKYI